MYPLFSENSNNVSSDKDFTELMLEDAGRMVHQGILDDCADYYVSAADLEEVQQPLKLNIRTLATKDWERTRKYFGMVWYSSC